MKESNALKVSALERPNIFEYDDFRIFLLDLISYSKNDSKDDSFTYRTLSEKAGFQSSSSIKLILDGKRTLSTKKILPLAKAFNLSSAETSFFENLVIYPRCC